MIKVLVGFVSALVTLLSGRATAAEIKVGELAPLFTVKDHTGADFSLESRKGQWTVLYFYPKSFTPGCTKQACAFRDKIKLVRAQGADVFGISADSVEAQGKFHKEHSLNFTILADPDSKIIEQYGAKMPLIPMSKRWTFVIDPTLHVRSIDKNVDPVKDAERVAASIEALKK